jgi:hypothetical protein
LKPAGPIDPVIESVDRALATGSANEVVTALAGRVAAGIRGRFARAQTRQKHADESVAAGREYVAAYVELLHYVERLHQDGSDPAGGNPQGPAVIGKTTAAGMKERPR